MKRTDIEKMEREQKKKAKKDFLEDKRLKDRDAEKTESYFINGLFDLFQYDESSIFNVKYSEKILELVMDMQNSLDSKDWENVFKKAIKRTKVRSKQEALEELKSLLS